MFDMLMAPKQRKGVNFLWLDPSNQITGDKCYSGGPKYTANFTPKL